MHWFKAVAPIRQKLRFAFNSLLALMALSTLVALAAPTLIALPILVILLGGAAVQCARYRSAIADPYVSTVVRMEALAAGDLVAPIQFTDYQDCVGRMTKAMLTFRDAAVAQQRLAQEQDEAVQRLGTQLERLSEGDLTAESARDSPTATRCSAPITTLRSARCAHSSAR
jgi:methyl-accepting chemotaxis protein